MRYARRWPSKAAQRREQRLAAGRSLPDWRVEIKWLAVLAIATVVLMTVFLELWKANFHVPFNYGGDSTLNLVAIKNIAEHGWYEVYPNLGAPFGAEQFDFPAGNADNLSVLIIKLLSLGSKEPALLMNAFFLLTFVLVALSAFVVARALSLSRSAAAVIALLFTFLPYHFERGENHLFLSAYYGVPIDAYLVLATVGGRRLFARRSGAHGILGWASERTLVTLVLCVVAGTTGLYYATFTLTLLAGVAILAALRDRNLLPVIKAAVLAAAIALTVLGDYMPSLIYEWQHGSDPIANVRVPQESEIYSLRLIELLLPSPYYRIAGLASPAQQYALTSPIPNGIEGSSSTLGTVGDVGFITLFGAIGLAVIGGATGVARRAPRDSAQTATATTGAAQGPPTLVDEPPASGDAAPAAEEAHAPPLGHLAVGAAIAFLIGTTGGFAALFSYLITPEFRGVARISVFIAFFSLLAVGVLLDRFFRWMQPRRHGVRNATAVLVAVLAFGLFDQTSPDFIPTYAATAASWSSDARFTSAIEHSLPKDSMVFELPDELFPATTADPAGIYYDGSRFFIHADSSISWSWGSVDGRPQDWSHALISHPLSVVLPAIVAAGFDGLVIDGLTYPAGGATLAATIAAQPGVTTFTSEDGRFRFFNLTGYARRLRREEPSTVLSALKAATLYPTVTSAYGAGFHPVLPAPGAPTWAAPHATLKLENPAPLEQPVTFASTLFLRQRGASTVLIRLPDGTTVRTTVSDTPRVVTIPFELPPGSSTLTIVTTPPVGQQHAASLRLTSVTFSPTAYEPFMQGPLAQVAVQAAGQ